MTASIAVSGIAAQAFRLLEMPAISSFGDDSEQAISATDQYPVALGICLEDSDWSFASVPVALPPVQEPSGDPKLPYVFQRPADLIRIQTVEPDDVAWRLDADRLRADAAGPLWVRYTKRVTDETRLPDLFKTAVAYRLASLLAPRWTVSANRAGVLLEASETYLEKARRSDRRSASSQRTDGHAREGNWDQVATSRGDTGIGR